MDWGGVYIVEDIECSYWKSDSIIYGYETGYTNIIDYFSKVNHSVNNNYSNHDNSLHIASISYHPNCIVITKKLRNEINEKEYKFKHNL